MKQIFVAFDFSPASVHALRWAAALARETHAHISICHVVPFMPPIVTPIAVPSTAPDPTEIAERRAKIERMADSLGVDVTIHVLAAPDIAEAVVAAADRDHADLIVQGTRAHGPIGRALLGSVADAVLRHASVPVVTMRDRVHG